MYTGDWTPDDAQAAGWGPEEEAALAQIYAGMDADARKLYDDKVLGSQMRGEIRQKIMAGTQPNKAKDMETAFEYGGRKGKAQEDADYFRRKAEESQNRPGVQVDYGRANQWDQVAGEDRLAGYESRGKAMSMADLMAARARGETPSIAGMRADRDIGRGIADQTSIGASARGPAAMALANQQAAANSSALTQRISNDAQINSAQERLQAEQGALQGYSGIRQGDTQQQGADLAGAAAAAQRAQAQAGFDDAQRGRNDAREQNMYGNEIGVNTTQLQAQGNKQAVRMGQQQAAIQNQQAKQARSDANVMGGIGAGASVLAGLASMFSDARAKDPVAPGDYEQQKAAAHAALDQYDVAQAATSGPMAVEGMSPGMGGGLTGALKRRDEQDAGLYRSKQRVGAPATWREEKDAAAAQGRLDRENEEASAKAKQAKRESKEEPKKLTMGDRLSKGASGALSGLGASLSGRANALRRDSVANVQMPHLTPYMMRSGMEMKAPAPMPEPPMPPPPTGPLAAQAFGGLNAMNASIDAGPSTLGAMNRQPTLQTFPSDDKTKLAAAFQDGITHADSVAKGIEPPKVPDYVPHNYVGGGAHGQNGIKFARSGPQTAPGKESTLDGMQGSKFPTVPIEDAAEANRALASSAYTYKPEFADKAGQPPGEVNVGPMTQRMEQSPIAATAVKHDEQGMGMIDVPKYTKVLGTGLSAAQKQIDELSLMVRRLRGNKK